MTASKEGTERVLAGYGAPYEVAELPAPPPFSWRNLLKIVGPGAIILSMSIGSGEWLMGPAATVQYGTMVLWIVTVGILTQTVFNMECIRYTMYTGEPTMVGFTRQWPGPRFWVPVWVILSFLSVGPGWVIGSATATAALFLGRMPAAADRPYVLTSGIVLMLIVLGILSIGGKIERGLEIVSKWIVGIIVISLVILNVAFVPAKVWLEVAEGFFQFGALPGGKVDWFLLGGLAGFAGAGGILNIAISNWMRDKGFGMGSVVGYIPSAIGGREIRVSNVGKVLKINPDSLKRWREWWKYALTDQLLFFMVGCFLGMYLCVTLAVGLIEKGTKVAGGWAAAAYQAQAVAKYLGGFGWIFVLGIGFWVLWGTQLAASDAFVRQMTDLLWNCSATARRWAKEDIRRVYYGILVLFTIWLAYIFTKGTPLFLVAFMANIASVCFVVGGIQLLFIDKFLPKEIRGNVWAKIALIVLIVFYGAFAAVAFGTQFFGLKL